ncbi:DUF5336 domain-containing protein [Mycolicibacterium sp.]|uniref:DUF5336 domain-containing protein n=1 Tax=Mycolicibacterium sp. TaxID=2320850 RepID=UPI001A342462|nr:DUF5336 domain-containing protein [Mycolicibacterium sp.]MBJ7337849.1 DUF5336 domain-containing protein [Mycolicibacterium sp.]
MSYPSGPSGNSGYPSGPPASQYNAPTQHFGQTSEAAPAGPSKLPSYLAIAVAVLGLAVYLANFGPVFTINAPNLPGFGPIGGSVSTTPIGITLATAIAVVAGLLAAVSLLPKQTRHDAWVAILSVLALLIVLSQIVGVPSGVSFGWALYLIIVFSVLQTAAAVASLLLDAGVISAPVPKPKYEQPAPYGQYGAPGPYYGQPQHGGPAHQQGPPQRGGYPSQQYGGYPGGPSTGGFGAQPGQPAPPSQQSAPQPQSGPPTPPTGFPAFGSPQGSLGSQPTQTFETQQPQQQAAPQSAPPPS